MTRLVLAAGLFCLLIAFAEYNENAKDRMNHFKWLMGNWVMKTKDGMITESWNTATATKLEGESSFIKNDSSVVPFETIQLVYRKKQYYYIVKAARQNQGQPVEFKLTAYSEKGFIAENPQHDFPRRIIYKLITKDSIHATIDDGEIKPGKKEDFFYSRKK